VHVLKQVGQGVFHRPAVPHEPRSIAARPGLGEPGQAHPDPVRCLLGREQNVGLCCRCRLDRFGVGHGDVLACRICPASGGPRTGTGPKRFASVETRRAHAGGIAEISRS